MTGEKLETSRLIIRPLDAELIRELSVDHKHDRFLSHMQKLAIDPTLRGWDAWIVQLKDGTYIGDIGFKGKPNVNREIEVGYGFEEAFHGCGYATESVDALMKYITTRYPELTIKAECLIDNDASSRVLEKLGFMQVRQDDIMKYWQK
ncbi:N-acetyltransferase [Macrococcus hajekii]|uniref:N-acetyltransferase n=1 Tax=Macrococcus hajekii TaxID=198482 RepID=A0A4R6BIH1_9STAP|nr:GNAT family N-acetyltransferase [Macrococcus hajekii]TDM01360.1 N-acetyltransferase [Macrococcus hajekii]GGB10961.1 N-acetyltransferase [Macrococcus hajekii]